jgi:mono/diheme cytochrome c family protein
MAIPLRFVVWVRQSRLWLASIALTSLLAFSIGCAGPISAHTWSRDYGLRRMPTEAPNEATGMKYDQRVDGGTLYKQHCSRCHNGRPLSERSFAQNEVSLAHMRDFSGLTGEEYRKIVQYMRRWHGVGPATPDVDTTPKRLFFNSPDRQGTLNDEPLVPDDKKEKAEAKIKG